ncbi:hypothetical protein T06_6876 [Trichinella sp. T6]|nr:hypothetical protein T06_6876 [Trichinella sp. T6]
MMANKQLLKMITCEIFRSFLDVQDNTTQCLEKVWVACALYELRIAFDYCSVHVSTVISYVSQQFRFLVFFIVTQWVVSVQWNYFYKLEYLSLMVVQVSLNGLKRCTKIFGLMALPSIAREISVASLIAGVHHTSLVVRVAITPGIASGYAPGQIKICIFPQATPKAFYCTIFDLRGFLCKFLIASGPRHRLRLCPRANKNLHIPAGYAQSILLHNI